MEAYLKKLCFEYQVDEREVKELLARMEMVYLDKEKRLLLPHCQNRACTLLFPVFCIHIPLMKEKREPIGFSLRVMLCYAIIQVSILSRH